MTQKIVVPIEPGDVELFGYHPYRSARFLHDAWMKSENELRFSRGVVRAARDFLPQETTSGGIGREDWNDLRATIEALDDALKAGI